MSRSSVSLAAVVAAVSMSAGCATTSATGAGLAPSAAAGTTVAVDQDHAYIQQVEAIARRRGIGVTWVNPPIKRRVVSR
jgi:hypothetical protein